jgi:hypothetical protein
VSWWQKKAFDLILKQRKMKLINSILFSVILLLPGCSVDQGKSELNLSKMEKGFLNPPHSAGVRCYWWWLNGNVTEEAITRDLEEMKDKGFNGALIFDADGSSQSGNRQVPAGPLFASSEWTKLFVHACKEANRLDLELSLNIQSGWNLGGPGVTADQATQQLVWSTTKAKGRSSFNKVLELPVEKGDYYRDVAVFALPVKIGSTIHPLDNLKLKSSTQELGGSAPDCRFLLNTAPALPGELAIKYENIINLTAMTDKDGILTWDVPDGDWEIIRLGHTATRAHVSTSSGEWQGRVIDHLSPAALQNYWNSNIAHLLDSIGPLAGTTLRYLHTDSWEGGGMNWTPGFEEEFKKRKGYDPLPWLPVLSGYIINNREESNAFLADFRKTIGDLVAGHYEEFARLAGMHGMGIHPESAGPHAGPMDGLKNYSHSEIVMSEFWSPSPHRPTPDRRFFVKQASSAAHTYGKKLVSAEAFTTMGPHWNDSPWEDMKPSLDHELCDGLNLVVHCLFVCSPKEMGMPGQETWAGTHFNPQITWWEEAKAFITYERRCQYLTQEGRFVADVVYYYGDHIPNIARRKDDDPAGALPGFDYDVLSEDLLVDAMTVEDGTLTLPSGMKYRVLVLPDHRVLSLAALRKVDTLVRNGATVLGFKPLKAVSLVGGENGRVEFSALADQLWGEGTQEETETGIREIGKGRIAWGMKVRDLLLQDGLAPDVEFIQNSEDSDLRWIHYRIGEDDVYFVCNQKPIEESTIAIFRCSSKVPEFWDAVDGSVRKANTFTLKEGRTEVPITFGPNGSLFVIFRNPAKGSQSNGPNFPTLREKQVIDGSWNVSFDPQWGGPDSVTFPELIDWTTHMDKGIKYYSGTAAYHKTFNIGFELQKDKQYFLQLGSIKDVGIAKVKINGKDKGILWTAPFRVDISKELQKGNNTLAIEVVNSWYNRVAGDQTFPDRKQYTSTNINLNRDFRGRPLDEIPLETSGLLGPVTIEEVFSN